FKDEKKEKIEFLWIGSNDGPEKKLARSENIRFEGISSGKLRRYWSFQNFLVFFKVITGFFQSILIIRKFKPELVFSKGGYVGVPVVLASYFLKIPSLIHESDISIGLANKMLLPFVTRLVITFEETKEQIKDKYKKKVVVTGNPIREDVLGGNKEQGLKELGFKSDKPVILILGGSQGAIRINEVIIKSLSNLLEKYQIVHLCGDNNYRSCGSLLIASRIKEKYDQNYKLYPSVYGSKLADIFACSDLVISRGGLNTLFELALLSKPSIIIPYPHAASNHQEKNAERIANDGAIELVKEDGLNSEMLIKKIDNLVNDSIKLEELRQKIHKFGQKVNKGASQKIIKELMSLKKDEESIKEVVSDYTLDSRIVNMDLRKIKDVYFVGIGGIGVSAVARILLEQGKNVSGSDLNTSDVTKDLESRGIKINIGEHKEENILKDFDLVVHSNAATRDNVELAKAKKFDIPMMSYPELLGLLSRDKFTICIAGTHGKTTVTALASILMDKGGLDPTCVIGSRLEQFSGNARLGKSKYFALEADEYKAAFLNYNPNIIVLNNIEFEHPDFYKDLDDVKDKFKQFVQKLPKDGLLIANFDDQNVMEVAKYSPCKVITYGIKDGADFNVFNIKQEGVKLLYSLKFREQEISTIGLNLIGIHNIYNTLAVIVLAKVLKLPLNTIKEVVEGYSGAWRRFEFKGEERGITVIDDYAHHPTEIKATLSGARMKYPKKRIIAVFQPHHEDRFEALFDDFVGSFGSSDKVILIDIYHVAGREDNKKSKVNSKDFSEKLGEKAVYTGDLDKTLDWLVENVKKDDLVITLGAGDVTRIGDELIGKLKK
ncbi:MAG: UDP-N-acetylmuramate--L-alanine ligase, partial [Parcubacteria group bacterium]|nr:UDP-N-acetylmuramate--L-alanine ligase [Parcubacteria group bacterium]